MSSKAHILHYSRVEDWELPRTHKNKIHTPSCDLGLLLLTSPGSSLDSLKSAQNA